MPDLTSITSASSWLSAPAPLAFLVYGDRHRAGSVVSGEQVIAGDWFVVAHLAFFFLLLGCFGLAVWSIWRRTTRPAPHMRLLMELQEESEEAGESALARGMGAGGETGRRLEREPWERSEDWWRQ